VTVLEFQAKMSTETKTQTSVISGSINYVTKAAWKAVDVVALFMRTLFNPESSRNAAARSSGGSSGTSYRSGAGSGGNRPMGRIKPCVSASG